MSRPPLAGRRAAVVDAFTDRPFAGNPAGIVLLDAADEAGEDWHQQLAAEFNLPETAFLRPFGGDRYGLRWFSPTVEVPLCGHATLASAHWLWEQGLAAGDRLEFETLSGVLAAAREPDGRVTLDLPLIPLVPPSPEVVEPLRQLLASAGVAGAEVVGMSQRPSLVKALVRLDGAPAVRTLAPDLAALRQAPVDGLLVTAPGDEPGLDVVSRFFAPAIGVDEDPVTGAAHCVLAGYWAGELGRSRFTAYQASARGGRLEVALAGDRVHLTGAAVTVSDVTVRA